MENKKYKFVLLLSVFVMWACNNNETIKTTNDFYSIVVKTFSDLDSVNSYQKELASIISDTMFVKTFEKADKQVYSLCLGKYNYSFDAGERGLSLWQDSIITNFKIIKGDSVIYDSFSNILFLGYNHNKVSLYNFNIVNKTTNMLWTDSKRNIISINGDEKNQMVYLLTADKNPKYKGYPILKNIEINKYDVQNNSLKNIDKISTLFQVFSTFEHDNMFKLTYLNFDSTNMQKVNKITNYYSSEGVKVESKFESFDVLKNGVPNLGTVVIKVKSPSGKHFIDFNQSDGLTQLFYKDLTTKVKTYITSANYSVSRIDWSNDERYVVIYLEKYDNTDMQSSIQSLLIAYDIKKSEMLYVVENDSNIDFILRSGYLVYEQINNNVKKIVIYNLKTKTNIHEIETKLGCGIKTLNIIEK